MEVVVVSAVFGVGFSGWAVLAFVCMIGSVV